MAMDPLFLMPSVPQFDPAETRSSASVRALSELVERGDLHVHGPEKCSCMQGSGSVAGLHAVLCRFCVPVLGAWLGSINLPSRKLALARLDAQESASIEIAN
jgi:hypothetical protein